MQLLFSHDQDMIVEKTPMQTLASQLSCKLLFSFNQDMRNEKTLIQTLASQLSLTLMQLLSSFDQDTRVRKTLIQTLACQLSLNHSLTLLSFFFRDTKISSSRSDRRSNWDYTKTLSRLTGTESKSPIPLKVSTICRDGQWSRQRGAGA